MQNSLFASEKFIEASRKFVCIRIETYESKESEAMVRKLLNGRFTNTSFAVFNPTGTQQISRAGRGPSALVSPKAGSESKEEQNAIIGKMNQIAARYRPKTAGESELQNFNSLRQALNVASADQRLLVFVNESGDKVQQTVSSLRDVFSDNEIVGKFHLNLMDETKDKNWQRMIQGANSKPGILIVRASQFGLDGTVMEQLPLNANSKEIKTALMKANETFAQLEKRKTYSSHVQQGRRKGIYFENEIPYGEDRDGDGKVDQKGGRRRGR